MTELISRKAALDEPRHEGREQRRVKMTDYNDGKWHGWNGGECPVAPDTLVNVACYEITVTRGGTWKADRLVWSHEAIDGDIVAFRVVREPRDFWLIGRAAMRDTEAEAIAYRDDLAVVFPGDAHRNLPIIHVREVL